MKLICGNKVVATLDTVEVCIIPDAIGTSTVGGNDLYDYGFTAFDLIHNDFIIEVKDVKIKFECQETKKKRMVKQMMDELKISETAAQFFLNKNNFNYGMARIAVEMARTCKGKVPIGNEIALGEVGFCNLGPITPEAVNTFLNRYARPSFWDKGKRPEVVTDPCICMDYVRGFGSKCQKCGKWPEKANEHLPAVPFVRGEREGS